MRRGDREFFTEMKRYCRRLSWVDDFKTAGDQILKFAASVPDERTWCHRPHHARLP